MACGDCNAEVNSTISANHTLLYTCVAVHRGSTDRSGCSGRAYDAGKTLDGSSDLQSIGVVAC